MLLAGNLILELPILLFCASNANSSKRLFQLGPCNRFGGRRFKSNNIFFFFFFFFFLDFLGEVIKKQENNEDTPQ